LDVDHWRVAHAILGPGLVFEHGVAVQDVWWGCHLWLAAMVAVFLAGGGDDDAAQISDTPGFVATPAQVYGKPLNTIERVLLMHRKQLSDGLSVTLPHTLRLVVVAALGHADASKEMPLPSRLDLFCQDG